MKKMGLFKKNNKLSWHEYTKEVFIEYLKARYPGKNFLPIALYTESNLIEFRAYPEGGDPKKDMICAYMLRDQETKEAKIKDNYFFECIRKEYEECVDKVLGQVLDKYKFFCIRSQISTTYAEEVKTEYNWADMKEHGVNIDIKTIIFTEDVLDKEAAECKLNDLKAAMEKEKFYGSISLYLLNQDCLDNVNSENFNDYNRRHKPEIGKQVIDRLHCVIRG